MLWTKIAKLVAYKKAPTTTFAVLHPIKTAKLVGAGMLVLPLGLWLARKIAG